MKKNLGKKRKKDENDVTEENHIEKKQNQFKFKRDYNNNKYNYVNSKNDAKNKIFYINKKDNINNSILHTSRINNIFNKKNLQKKNTKAINQKVDLDKINSSKIETIQNYNDFSSNSPKKEMESLSKNNDPEISSTKFMRQRNYRDNSFGLKEISNRVMNIIKENGQTTYKDISDKIINEINEKNSKEERSLKRRIYDSLNVMKNMNLFSQDKQSKTITWNYAQEIDPLNDKNEKNDENMLESDKIIELKKEIKLKKENAVLLEKELKALKNVLERNRREDEKIPENKRLYFPLIIVEFFSNKEQKINVALNEDQTKAHLGFDEANFMYGDLEIISKIGNHPKFSK